MNPTENPEEYKQCLNAFIRWHGRYFQEPTHRNRHKKFPPGVGLFKDPNTNTRWSAWRACWNYLR